MSLPSGWNAMENAIIAWIVAGSGLATSKVVWAQQSNERPAGAYISVRLRSIATFGEDWDVISDNPTPTAGAEILRTTRGMRRLTVGMQAFAGVDGAGTGATAPFGLLHGVAAAAESEIRQAALDAGGVGIMSVGPVQSIDGTLGAGLFEPRAVLEVLASVTSEMVETATYIETVEVTNEMTDDVFEIG